jgi:hypothetical protein
VLLVGQGTLAHTIDSFDAYRLQTQFACTKVRKRKVVVTAPASSRAICRYVMNNESVIGSHLAHLYSSRLSFSLGGANVTAFRAIYDGFQMLSVNYAVSVV